MIFSVLIAILAVLALIIILSAIGGRRGSGKGSKQKNRAQIIREATRKLSHDPHNTGALLPLADLYYSESLWEKALPLYETLMDLAPTHPEIDEHLVSLRQGICSIKNNKNAESIKGLSAAYKKNPNDFETNYYLGMACYKNNDFEKAVPCFKKAFALNSEALNICAPLGQCLYKAHHYKEALPMLKRALTENPEDKESLFAMADAMQESGYGDKALKVFMHLRPDPVFGAKSSLAAGLIHTRMGQQDKAIQDFEIGLKLKDVPPEIFLELNYRLAQCYFAMNKIPMGLACLNSIQTVAANYKDVSTLISRYKELNSNSNLQIYLTAGASDFVVLCRNLVKAFYAQAYVKIIDVDVTPECVEILCEVETTKWEDSEVFRFYRSTGVVGELFIRDLHTKIRDKKVDRGFCITPGTFSEEAHKYIEGRPIDLVEKAQLMKLLKAVSVM